MRKTGFLIGSYGFYDGIQAMHYQAFFIEGGNDNGKMHKMMSIFDKR
jgi:hypothetical protein